MDQRNQAIGMLSAGVSQRHVARVMNCNQSTISDRWNRYQKQGQARDRPRSECPHVTTAHQDRCTRLTHARDRFLPAAEAARHTVGTHNRPINGNTVRQRLTDVGLKSRRIYTGQVLLRRHKQARLALANAHTRWPRQRWETVLFSDESKFNLSNSDVRVFRRTVEVLLNVVSWRLIDLAVVV